MLKFSWLVRTTAYYFPFAPANRLGNFNWQRTRLIGSLWVTALKRWSGEAWKILATGINMGGFTRNGTLTILCNALWSEFSKLRGIYKNCDRKSWKRLFPSIQYLGNDDFSREGSTKLFRSSVVWLWLKLCIIEGRIFTWIFRIFMHCIILFLTF